MKRIYLFISVFFFAFTVYGTEELVSNEESHNKSDKEEAFDPTPMIMHHINDSHYWHLFDLTDKESGKVHPVSIPLPVILIYKGNLDIFLSSKFHHGETSVKKEDREYFLFHDKIYAIEETGLLLNKEHHPTNPKPWDFSITKNVASLLLSAMLLLAVFIPIARKYKKGKLVPSGLQGFLEPIVLFIKEDIAEPNIGKHNYQKFLPYLLTAFFFIWFNNMLGLIPFFPGGANLTGNIAVTMTLAFFTLVLTSKSGSKTYWGHVFTPPVPKWLWIIMIPVEIIGVLSKPFALMIRLFANITAGHIIVLSLVSLIFIFKTVWISPASIILVLFMDVLELLVALLQAYIFTLLSALFIGLAVQEHH
jgi:F-type H+-transporting ATPase subunit a